VIRDFPIGLCQLKILIFHLWHQNYGMVVEKILRWLIYEIIVLLVIFFGYITYIYLNIYIFKVIIFI